jgi:hypothetical protein
MTEDTVTPTEVTIGWAQHVPLRLASDEGLLRAEERLQQRHWQ